MAYKEKSEAIKYNNDFNKKAYDRINLTIPKGQKEVIQAAAEAKGESVNAYIYAAILQRINREGEANKQVGGGSDISTPSADSNL